MNRLVTHPSAVGAEFEAGARFDVVRKHSIFSFEVSDQGRIAAILSKFFKSVLDHYSRMAHGCSRTANIASVLLESTLDLLNRGEVRLFELSLLKRVDRKIPQHRGDSSANQADTTSQEAESQIWWPVGDMNDASDERENRAKNCHMASPFRNEVTKRKNSHAVSLVGGVVGLVRNPPPGGPFQLSIAIYFSQEA